jgi:hypothetical protein
VRFLGPGCMIFGTMRCDSLDDDMKKLVGLNCVGQRPSTYYWAQIVLKRLRKTGSCHIGPHGSDAAACCYLRLLRSGENAHSACGHLLLWTYDNYGDW